MDDQEEDRYLIKGLLAALGRFEIIEARPGTRRCGGRRRKPDVIFLDLVLPDMTGFEVLDRLKADDETRDIPVIINTSRILDEDERGSLDGRVVAILDKGNWSRERRDGPPAELAEKAGLDPPAAGRAES